MSGAVSTAPVEVDRPSGEEVAVPDRPWVVIVWNDPINLMSYVTWVFQKLFGYSLEKATGLMLDVHHKGKAVVSSGPRWSSPMGSPRRAEKRTHEQRRHDRSMLGKAQRSPTSRRDQPTAEKPNTPRGRQGGRRDDHV